MSYLLPDDIIYRAHGLSEKEARSSREKYGSNEFTRRPRKTFFKQYLSAFGDPIIKILLIALALNLIIALKGSNIYEPLGIAIALFLATFVSTLSEYGSESAFLKLEQQSAGATARVMRSGKLVLLPIGEIAVGDTVYIGAGERVPADGIIVSGNVCTDMSALNGESDEVARCASKPGRAWELSDRGQLFRGAVITSGECIMCVGRTGDETFYGNVAAEIQSGADVSPLTQKLQKLANVLSRLGTAAAVLVFAADLFNLLVLDSGFNRTLIMQKLVNPQIMVSGVLHALTLAITVMVMAVPEGLPMMITVVLSSNMRKLKRDNVLVRKLTGIEASGCLNILFCDKTGTLTDGRLSVSGFYDISGNFFKSIPKARHDDIVMCCRAPCESVLIRKKAVGGNATDRAMLEFTLHEHWREVRVSEKIPFDSAKKLSAAKVGGTWYVRGAPEIIFKSSDVGDDLLARWHELTRDGIRVSALAKSTDMKNFSVIGLLAIRDRIRRDARYSVKTVQDAGISVCMVTGDNHDTALAIARSCGIITENAAVLTSSELARLSDGELAEILPRLKLVSRALPTDKSRLARVAKAAGLVCGMTGDGINDAPALRCADVGFAMGSGTEVAKQAGDIVILDDNFTSISKAILYGRTIFKSIRKFIVFQLTMNLCAVGISVIGPFIGVDTPVTVMQMLWINIIMDTLAGLAFAGEPPLRSYMQKKPISRAEHVLNGRMAGQILTMGLYGLGLCTLFLSTEYFKRKFGFYSGGRTFMTAFFALFIFTGIFAAFSARSEGIRILKNLAGNRAFLIIFIFIAAVQLWLIYCGGELFRTGDMPWRMLPEILALSASVLPVDALRKLIFKARSK